MTDGAPHLTAGFWRTRRSAAIAGIVFGVVLLVGMTMLRIALSEGSLQTLQADTQRRTLIRISLGLVPFAGIAFLWFIGVVREQLGAVEDRLFSTVFMGSGRSGLHNRGTPPRLWSTTQFVTVGYRYEKYTCGHLTLESGWEIEKAVSPEPDRTARDEHKRRSLA